MDASQYNVTIELTETDHEVVADRVLDTEPGRMYSVVVHAGPEGHPALTMTVPNLYLDAAVDHALAVTRHVWELTPYAVTALPTTAFDIRANLTDAMLSVPQAAERLGVSEQRVRQLLGAGKLGGEKVGRDWLVSSASVAARLGV